MFMYVLKQFMKTCLPAILLCMVIHSKAQTSSLQSVLKTDSVYLKKQWSAIEARYNQDVAAVTGEYKKYIKDIYKERLDYLKTCFSNDAIVSDPEAVAYLDGITKKIVSNNPALQKIQPRVLLYKAWWPNAASIGEGTILVNIGIIYKFKNDAQLAFVLCHELAHLYLDHGNKGIQKYVNTVYDDEFQKELKRIAKQQYEKNKRLNELEKSIAFTSRRHSRSHESEADSVAIEFMKNTDFSLEEAKTSLAMLDSIDNDKYNIEPAISKYFNHPSYPFKKSWTKQDDDFFGAASKKVSEKDKKLIDSLKTHPDCMKRVDNITAMVTRYSKPGTILSVNEADSKRWQQAYDYEVIAYAYKRDNISLALYQSLQTLDFYPGDAWLIAMIGQCMNKMYVAQKKHEIGKIIELPSPYQEKKYNNFLQFLQNLSLSDIAMINYHFLESNKANAMKDEDFVYALINSKEPAGKPEEKKEWIQYYKSNFPKPRYTF